MGRTLLHRANTICDVEYKNDKFLHIREVLLQNKYPGKFINNVKRKIFNNNGNDNNSISTPKLKYCVAPCIKNVSERVARILKQFHIHLSHRPSFKIKNKLCNIKDICEPPYQAGVIYKMCCNNCDAVYIGETGRHLE